MATDRNAKKLSREEHKHNLFVATYRYDNSLFYQVLGLDAARLAA